MRELCKYIGPGILPRALIAYGMTEGEVSWSGEQRSREWRAMGSREQRAFRLRIE